MFNSGQGPSKMQLFSDNTSQRNNKQFGTQIYKLCDWNGYLYDMKVYDDNCKCNSERSRVDTICIRIISSPDLCDNLHTGKIHCCGPMRYIIKEESHRIFTRRNSDWKRVTFRWVRGDFIEMYDWDQVWREQ
jgi:hypothetical protein